MATTINYSIKPSQLDPMHADLLKLLRDETKSKLRFIMVADIYLSGKVYLNDLANCRPEIGTMQVHEACLGLWRAPTQGDSPDRYWWTLVNAPTPLNWRPNGDEEASGLHLPFRMDVYWMAFIDNEDNRLACFAMKNGILSSTLLRPGVLSVVVDEETATKDHLSFNGRPFICHPACNYGRGFRVPVDAVERKYFYSPPHGTMGSWVGEAPEPGALGNVIDTATVIYTDADGRPVAAWLTTAGQPPNGYSLVPVDELICTDSMAHRSEMTDD